jgi:peptidoglycan hydrolase-like protein with peptidoglycan-binding domain
LGCKTGATLIRAFERKTASEDGDFGEKTEARVKAFQGRIVPDDDGIVGPRTWNKRGAWN